MADADERVARLEARVARLEADLRDLRRRLAGCAEPPLSRPVAVPAAPTAPPDGPRDDGVPEPLRVRALLYAVSLIEADADDIWERAASGLDISAESLEASWGEHLRAAAGDLERARGHLVRLLREGGG